MFQFAANLTLIIHLMFIIFVVLGAFLYLVSTKIIYIHLPALAWAIYLELSHSICPLTHLENWFLQKSNLPVYSESFIQRYIVPVIYPNKLTEDFQIFLGIVLMIVNLILYVFIFSRTKRTNNPPK